MGYPYWPYLGHCDSTTTSRSSASRGSTCGASHRTTPSGSARSGSTASTGGLDLSPSGSSVMLVNRTGVEMHSYTYGDEARHKRAEPSTFGKRGAPHPGHHRGEGAPVDSG